MDKVRIGFVGVGAMGQCAHLKNYATLPNCEVSAIAELRPELGRKVAAKHGVPRVYSDHRAMLAEEQLDGIVASQPFTRHGQLVPELLEAGVPVFTEKPLAGSVEAGERLLHAVGKSGTWHMIGYHKRSDPATIYAKAAIERLKATGELGRIRYVRILMPAGDWIGSGFTDLVSSDEPMPPLESDAPASDLDGATYDEYVSFVNYYIHQVNLMRHLLGEPYCLSHADKAGLLIVAESESGITGTIEMSPYTTTLDWQEEALVAFEHGYVKLWLPAPLAVNRPGRVEVLRDPGHGACPETVTPSLPWVDAMRQQAMTFVAAVRGEVAPPCEAREALDDLLAAREYIRLRFGK